jgi:hypothetical protein
MLFKTSTVGAVATVGKFRFHSFGFLPQSLCNTGSLGYLNVARADNYSVEQGKEKRKQQQKNTSFAIINRRFVHDGIKRDTQQTNFNHTFVALM